MENKIIEILDVNQDNAEYWKEDGLRDTIISELQKFERETRDVILRQVQDLVYKIDPNFHQKVSAYRLKEQGIEITDQGIIFRSKDGKILAETTPEGYKLR